MFNCDIICSKRHWHWYGWNSTASVRSPLVHRSPVVFKYIQRIPELVYGKVPCLLTAKYTSPCIPRLKHEAAKLALEKCSERDRNFSLHFSTSSSNLWNSWSQWHGCVWKCGITWYNPKIAVLLRPEWLGIGATYIDFEAPKNFRGWILGVAWSGCQNLPESSRIGC
jgi:hypothetical protein